MPWRRDQPMAARCARPQRLGHEHVVVDGDDVPAEPADEGGVGVGAEGHRGASGPSRARCGGPRRGRPGRRARACRPGCARRCAPRADSQARRRPQARRAGLTRAHPPVPEPGQIGGGAHLGLQLVPVQEGELLTVPPAPGSAASASAATWWGSVATDSSPVRSKPQSIDHRPTVGLDAVEVVGGRGAPGCRSRRGSVRRRWPARGSGWRRRSPRSAPRRPTRSGRPRGGPRRGRVGRLGQQRGPQTGVAAAHHGEIGSGPAHQGGAGGRGRRVVQPERDRGGIGQGGGAVHGPTLIRRVPPLPLRTPRPAPKEPNDAGGPPRPRRTPVPGCITMQDMHILAPGTPGRTLPRRSRRERATMKVGVVGASGYAGVELLRLCAAHPDLEVVVATAGGHRGQSVAGHTPSLAAAYPTLTYAPTEPAELDGLDVVFLALPHGQSQHLVPELIGPGRGRRRPGRRLPPSRPLPLPDLVRRAPRGPRAARPVRLRAARAPPGRAARRPLIAAPGAIRPPPSWPWPRWSGPACWHSRPCPVRRGPAPHRGRGQRGLGGRPGPEGQPPLRGGGRGLRGLRPARPPAHRRDGAGPRRPGPVHPPPRPHGPGHPGHLLRPPAPIAGRS